MIDRVLGAIGWFISGWIGAYLGYLYTHRMARRQKAEADAETREAYLRHLHDELAFNRDILWEMITCVNGGPPILEILQPVDVASTHLRFTAWDALIRAGVLANMMPADRALLGAADRAGREAAEKVQTKTATWRRGLAWQQWATAEQAKGELVGGVAVEALLVQLQEGTTNSLHSALKRTDEALALLNKLLPPEHESPALLS